MKKWLIIFLVSVVAVIGLNAKVFSMGQASKDIQVSGKITEINLKSLTVKIIPKTGDAVVFKVNKKTKLTKGEKNITFSSLKKDDQVSVTYKTSWGKKVALEIVVRERVVVPQKTVPIKNKK